MKHGLFEILGALFLIFALQSCFHFHHHNVDISINDKDEDYQLSASYPQEKTRAVENFIKHCTEHNSHFSFSNHANIDGNLILDDNTKFYLKSREGYLKIKFNKEDNSTESYEKVKDMCEGIKNVLVNN